mgnify:CR=1 FL=1
MSTSQCAVYQVKRYPQSYPGMSVFRSYEKTEKAKEEQSR